MAYELRLRLCALLLFAVGGCVSSGARSVSSSETGGDGATPPSAGGDAALEGAPVDGGNVDAPVPSGPALASLDLAGFTLLPAFSPSTYDYVVRCAAGANSTTITATAPDGVSVALLQPSTTPLSQPVALSLDENDAVVAEATAADGTTADYWVRCLPHDFPDLSLTRMGQTTPGYYVTGNTTVASGESGYAMVLDGNGTPVWYRVMPTGTTAGYVTVIGTDTLAYMDSEGGRFGTDPAGHFQIVNLDTGAETSVATVGTPTDLHELLPLANGDFMMLSYAPTTGIDMSSRGITTTTTIADCNVQEVAPDGTLVWSWLGSDHMDVVTESTELAAATLADGTAAIDPFHCNAIDVDPNGDLLVSVRQADAVLLVSRATGQVAWKLGGIPWNKDGAAIIQLQGDSEGSFYHQHDARFLANGDVTLYDDHTTEYDTQMPPANVARGMEIAFDVDAGTASTVFQYAASASASATGSFRRYSDGSSVVGWGFLGSGAPALAMTELDDAGNPLVELTFVDGDYLYRALKVPTTSLDLGVMRSTAGQ